MKNYVIPEGAMQPIDWQPEPMVTVPRRHLAGLVEYAWMNKDMDPARVVDLWIESFV